MAEEKEEPINPMMEEMKKQWAAMGIDPNQMLSYMNNAMGMQQNIQDQVNQAMGSNPFLQNLMGMAGGQAPAGDMLNMFDDSPEVKEDSDLAPAELKAVLCGANIAYASTQYLNTLSTYRPVEDILEGLENAWSISSREDLLGTLDWLEKNGHKVYFDIIWAKLSTLPKAEWRAGIKSLELQAMADTNIEPERLMTYATHILEGYPGLLSHGIFAKAKTPDVTAWDLTRAINLCRFGFDIEYLTRYEALQKIQAFAQKLYSTYDSWRSLSEGYVTGFAMWSGEGEDLDKRIEQHGILLQHPKSLWTKISWK